MATLIRGFCLSSSLFFSCFTLAVSFFSSRNIGEKVCNRDVRGSHTQYLLLPGCCCSWWWRREILVKPFSLFFVSASKKQRGWCGVEVCSEAKRLGYWSRLPLTLGKPLLWAISEAPSNPPWCILSSPFPAPRLIVCWYLSVKVGQNFLEKVSLLMAALECPNS